MNSIYIKAKKIDSNVTLRHVEKKDSEIKLILQMEIVDFINLFQHIDAKPGFQP